MGINVGLNNSSIAFINNASYIAAGQTSQSFGSQSTSKNKFNLLCIGIIIQILGLQICNILALIENCYIFAIFYLNARIAQGSGDALIMVTSQSILAHYQSGNQFHSKLALVNSSICIGIAIGPPLGSVIYWQYGEQFYYGLIIFGILQGLLVIPLQLNQNHKNLGFLINSIKDKFIPKKFNYKYNENNENTPAKQTEILDDQLIKINHPADYNSSKYDSEKNNISNLHNSNQIKSKKCLEADKLSQLFIIKHDFVVQALFSGFLSLGIAQMPGPIMAQFLQSHQDLSPLVIGLFFSLINLSELFGSLLMQFQKLNYYHNQQIIGQSFIIMGLIGISQPWCFYFYTCEFQLESISIGLVLLGFGMIIGFVMVVPGIIDSFESHQELNEEEKNKINDLSSGLFGMTVQVSGFVCPFLGGIISDEYGFQPTFLIISIFPIIQLLLVCINLANSKSIILKLKE